MKPFFCWIILFLMAIFVRTLLVISVVAISLELISDILNPAINTHGNLLIRSAPRILTVARKSWFIKLLWVVIARFYFIILVIIIKSARLLIVSHCPQSKHRLFCICSLEMAIRSCQVRTSHNKFSFIQVVFLTCSYWSIIICSLAPTTTPISITAIVSLITGTNSRPTFTAILGCLDLSSSLKVGELRVL